MGKGVGDLWIRALRRLRSHGPARSFAYLRHRIVERVRDERLGIRTTGTVQLTRLGIHDPDCKPYAPTAYESFEALMDRLTIRPDDVLLDYGAGKGRVLILAARLPFKRVIGVEISEELAEIARANLRRARGGLAGRSVEVVAQNAAIYRVPDDVTVVYFFDPFKDETLRQVVGELKASLERAPRVLTILYADAQHFEPIAAESDWIDRIATVPYPFAWDRSPSIRYEHRIYRACLQAVTAGAASPQGGEERALAWARTARPAPSARTG